MRKWAPLIAAFAGLCITTSAHADATSVHFEVGYGTEDSMVYDLSVQHALAPWISGQNATLSPFIRGGVAAWTNGNHAKDLWAGSLGVGLLLDFHGYSEIKPFVSGSFSGAVLTRDTYGKRELGCKGQFRSQGGAGVKFGQGFRHTIKVDYSHYSNANLCSENDAFNIVGVSYGFNF